MSYKDEDNFIIAISRLEILLLKTWRVDGGGGEEENCVTGNEELMGCVIRREWNLDGARIS